jgi:hypothetical protein
MTLEDWVETSLSDKEVSNIMSKVAPLGETVKRFVSNDKNDMITESFIGCFK